MCTRCSDSTVYSSQHPDLSCPGAAFLVHPQAPSLLSHALTHTHNLLLRLHDSWAAGLKMWSTSATFTSLWTSKHLKLLLIVIWQHSIIGMSYPQSSSCVHSCKATRCLRRRWTAAGSHCTGTDMNTFITSLTSYQYWTMGSMGSLHWHNKVKWLSTM